MYLRCRPNQKKITEYLELTLISPVTVKGTIQCKSYSLTASGVPNPDRKNEMSDDMNTVKKLNMSFLSAEQSGRAVRGDGAKVDDKGARIFRTTRDANPAPRPGSKDWCVRQYNVTAGGVSAREQGFKPR
jgi:hypothetical protein